MYSPPAQLESDLHDAFNLNCGYSSLEGLPHPPGHPAYTVRPTEDGQGQYLDMCWNKPPRHADNKKVYDAIIKRIREADNVSCLTA
jgi:hypothetical protein